MNSQKKTKILCTLGPASLNKRVIKRLEDLDVNVFRLNLSHIRPYQLRDMINTIRENSDVPICIDTEGAQVRTSEMTRSTVELRENTITNISKARVPGDSHNFNLYPIDIVDQLEKNDFLSIDFKSVYGQVISKNKNGVQLRILKGGVIGPNKAVTVDKNVDLPPLTQRDLECIKIANEMGIKMFALSFASSAKDVNYFRNLINKDSFLISKVESKNGLRDLQGIIDNSDAVLIDRGDLSREIPIHKVPRFQKHIIEQVKKTSTEVYVATNLLESMIDGPQPTRAEVNDIYNTLTDQADGLVLAAETAIGKYPIESARMVKDMIDEFHHGSEDIDLTLEMDDLFISNLVTPHGGELVNQLINEKDIPNFNEIQKTPVSIQTILDCEQIALGTYSPLKGFLSEVNLDSVLNSYKLKDGTVWTLPIVLQANDPKLYKENKQIVLQDQNGLNHSLLTIRDIYKKDLKEVATKWFGTNDEKHPGVKHLYAQGEYFIEADVQLINSTQTIDRKYNLNPSQLRHIFAKKGWQKIVGFHTRNVPHLGHEFIQKHALELSHADGLFIGPVVGPKKTGDFNGKPILEAYQSMIDFGVYPENKVFLSSFATYSRYSGPREAVFTALCRKNMGCSHFIVGRDHTGVSNYYAKNLNQDLFELLGDIGIEIVFCDTVSYNSKRGEVGFGEQKDSQTLSGTIARDYIKDRKPLPSWLMRDIVQDKIFSLMDDGEEIFRL